MSKTYDKLQEADQPAKYHLRTPDGASRGPFEVSVLLDWAAHNRIPPGSMAAADGRTWIPARELPDLKMEWVVQLANGRVYGPFNLLAAPLLVRDGVISPDARLINQVSGRTVLVRQLLKAPAAAADDESSRRLTEAKEAEWESRYHDERKHRLEIEAEQARRIDELTEKAQTYELRLEQVLLDLETEKGRCQALREEAGQKEQEFAERIKLLEEEAQNRAAQYEEFSREAQNQAGDSKGLADDLRRQLEEREKEYDSFREKAQQHEKELQERISQPEKGTEENVLQRAEELEKKTNEYSMRLEEADRALMEQKKQSAEKQDELNRQIKHLREEADKSAGRVKELTAELEQNRQFSLKIEASRTDMDKELAGEAAALRQESQRLAGLLEETRQELAGQKNGYESLAAESRQKEQELQQCIEVLQKESHEAAVLLEEVRKELTEEKQRYRQLEAGSASREKALSGEIASLRPEVQGYAEALDRTRKEARESAQLLGRAQKDLAETEKQYDSLKTISRKKEQALEQKIRQMQEQAGQAGRPAGILDRVCGWAASAGPAPRFAVGGAIIAGLILCAFIAGTMRGRRIQALPEDIAGTETTTEAEAEQSSALLPRPETVEQPVERPVAAPAEEEPAVVEKKAVTPPEPVKAPAVISRPDMRIEGVTVTEKDNAGIVVFDYGVFSYFTILQEEAKKQLREIGLRFRQCLRDFSLVVEGHTDTVPVSSASSFNGNYELGLARAEAVIEFLKTECDLPADSLIAASAGETDPPYPNDTPESQRKNRTVVLKLVPRRSGVAPARR